MKEGAELAVHEVSEPEPVSRVGVHDEVQVPVSEPGLGAREPGRQRSERRREQRRQPPRQQRRPPVVGPRRCARRRDVVAPPQQPEQVLEGVRGGRGGGGEGGGGGGGGGGARRVGRALHLGKVALDLDRGAVVDHGDKGEQGAGSTDRQDAAAQLVDGLVDLWC